MRSRRVYEGHKNNDHKSMVEGPQVCFCKYYIQDLVFHCPEQYEFEQEAAHLKNTIKYEYVASERNERPVQIIQKSTVQKRKCTKCCRSMLPSKLHFISAEVCVFHRKILPQNNHDYKIVFSSNLKLLEYLDQLLRKQLQEDFKFQSKSKLIT